MSKCSTCTKTVYFAERVSAGGKDFHKLCFKCKQCKKQLEPAKFSERDGLLYCKTCYGSLFAPKGYGFGNSIDSFSSAGAPAVNSAASGESHSTGVVSGAKFCEQCGVNVAGAKFCGQCGHKVN